MNHFFIALLLTTSTLVIMSCSVDESTASSNSKEPPTPIAVSQEMDTGTLNNITPSTEIVVEDIATPPAKIVAEDIATPLAEIVVEDIATPPAKIVVEDIATPLAEIVEKDIATYDRAEWNHWIDSDKDCQNTRHEVLQVESLVPVTFKSDNQCQVESGEWYDAYTGETITDASKLDIDHMVPLNNAHISGGWAWDKVTKSKYANYMEDAGHLIAVSASANRQKGARSPDQWKPSNQNYWCNYATDWVAIKNSWQLDFTKSESDAIEEMLNTCTDSISTPTPSPIPTSTPSPVPTSTPSPDYAKSQISSIKFSNIDCKSNPESVVISNNGYLQQIMSGWKIYDEGSKHIFDFPDGFVLKPNILVTIITGATGYDTNEKIFWKKQAVWNNSGDIATLIDDAGNIIDTMECSP